MSARRSQRAAFLLLLGLSAPVAAGVTHHTVAPGESASSIAHRYYGSYELADVLMRVNDKPGAIIHPGEKLRIPYCDVHRVEAGDTWSVLARRYLGRASAFRAVAVLNGLAPERPLKIGQRIVFPVSVPYPIERGDTLRSVSERFYGKVDAADALREFNEIDDPRRLAVGQRIEVPLTTLRLRAKRRATPAKHPTGDAGPKPVARAAPSGEKAPGPGAGAGPTATAPKPEGDAPKPAPAPVKTAEPSSAETRSAFDGRIAEVRGAFVHGDYDRAKRLADALQPVVASNGTDRERAELSRLRAFVYVAFDRNGEACAAYAATKANVAREALDPDLVSPKIREVLEHCEP